MAAQRLKYNWREHSGAERFENLESVTWRRDSALARYTSAALMVAHEIPPMCRYAWHNYRDHFACFDCRKTFKIWQWEDCEKSEWKFKKRLHHVPREVLCPDCGQSMVDMGLDFKAPHKDNREAWQILAILFDYGFDFHGCGCDAGGFVPPRTLGELPVWLEKHKRSSKGELLLNKFKPRRR
jgi:hypothetical protein